MKSITPTATEPHIAEQERKRKAKHSPEYIAKALADDLGIGQFIGTMKFDGPKEALGYYQRRAKYIATDAMEAGNYGTTLHEDGHAMQDVLEMEATDEMVDNLIKDPEFPSQAYKHDQLKREAFAEFVRRYLEDEDSAVAFAGQTYVDEFKDNLRKHGLLKKVNAYAEDLQGWINADVNDKIGAYVHPRNEKEKGKLKRFLNKAVFELIDESKPAEQVNKVVRGQAGTTKLTFSDDLRKNVVRRNFSARKTSYLLTENLVDRYNKRIGDSLADRLEATGFKGSDKNISDLENYLLAKHSLDRDQQGKAVFDKRITTDDRINLIREIDQSHPEIKAAADALHSFWNDFMQEYMVNSGYLMQEELNEFNRIYPNYVPNMRVKDERASDMNLTSSKKYTIKEAKGSTEDIWSPIDTMVGMMNRIINMNANNDVAKTFDHIYRKYSLGMFGREITGDLVKSTVDTTTLRNKVEKLLTNNAVAQDVIDDIVTMIGDEQTGFKRMRGSNMPNVLTVQLEDGSQRYYEISDTDLYKTLAGIGDDNRVKETLI